MYEIKKIDENILKMLSKELDKYDKFWNVNILKEEVNNSNSEYYVITKDDEIHAFGGLWFNIDEAHIMNIAVRDDTRRKGLGAQLLLFLIELAKKKNKKCITLEVREDNKPAIKLYEKMNFEVVGKRKRYYNNNIDAIIMTKSF